jgi:hypothetical protein
MIIMQIANQAYLIVVNIRRHGNMVRLSYQPKLNILRFDLNILS